MILSLQAIILAFGSGVLVFLILIRISGRKKEPTNNPRGMVFATSVAKKGQSYVVEVGTSNFLTVKAAESLGLIYLYPNTQVAMLMTKYGNLSVFWLEDPITGLPIRETCAFAQEQVPTQNGKSIIKLGDGELANITWQIAGAVNLGRYKARVYVYHPKTVKSAAKHIFYFN